jgi:predicted O-methyltransferase YrrM
LTHPTAKATGIDIFPDKLKKRFLDNLKTGGFLDKVTVIQGWSQVELRRLPLDTYDIIYIDGSHLAKDVLTDAVLCWPLLKDNGIIIFDDYKWKLDRPVQLRPKSAIDSFLVCFGGLYELIHRGYQIIIRKQKLWEPVAEY